MMGHEAAATTELIGLRWPYFGCFDSEISGDGHFAAMPKWRLGQQCLMLASFKC